MALKEDSASATTNPSTATIDASIKLMLATMQRIGERIEGRDVRIEPCIDPALAVFATIYNEPVFNEEFVVDEQPVLTAEPIYDEEPVFNTEPVFDEDSVVDEEFDAGPIFDEEPCDFTTAGCDVDFPTTGYNVVIFDEGPDDFDVLGCRVALFEDPDITYAMAAHISTARPRQAPMTTSIDKEVVLDSGLAAMTLAATADVQSDMNTNAPTTCSTKCADHSRDVVTGWSEVVLSDGHVSSLDIGLSIPPPLLLTVLYAKEFVSPYAKHGDSVLQSHASPSNITIRVPVKCSVKYPNRANGSSVSICRSAATAVLSFSTTTNMQSFELLNTKAQLFASLGASHMFYKMCQAIVLNIFSSEYLPCDRVALWGKPMNHVDSQSWPPPVLLQILHNSAQVRPKPWPFFISSYVCAMSWDDSTVWKPPWPYLIVGAMRFATWCLSWSVKSPWLDCELVGGLVQQNHGGNCGFSLLEKGQLKIIEPPSGQPLVSAQFQLSVNYFCDIVASLWICYIGGAFVFLLVRQKEHTIVNLLIIWKGVWDPGGFLLLLCQTTISLLMVSWFWLVHKPYVIESEKPFASVWCSITWNCNLRNWQRSYAYLFYWSGGPELGQCWGWLLLKFQLAQSVTLTLNYVDICLPFTRDARMTITWALLLSTKEFKILTVKQLKHGENVENENFQIACPSGDGKLIQVIESHRSKDSFSSKGRQVAQGLLNVFAETLLSNKHFFSLEEADEQPERCSKAKFSLRQWDPGIYNPLS